MLVVGYGSMSKAEVVAGQPAGPLFAPSGQSRHAVRRLAAVVVVDGQDAQRY